MRIAVWHNLLSGGAKRALFGQVSGLLARGHEIEIWCPETADQAYLPLSTLAVEHRLGFSPGVRRDPIGWKRFLLRRANAHKLAREMDRHSAECAKQIGGGGFDLVFVAPCSYYGVPRLGQFFAGQKMPVALYLQEPWRRLYEAQPELPWLALRRNGSSLLSLNRWKTLLWDRQHITLCREAARREVEDARAYDVIFANSYFSRESIARAYNLDASVAYLGCDTNLFRPLRLHRKNLIVGLGSAHWFKRMDSAIEAVACLPEPRPKLVWIANTGDSEYEDSMLALATLRGVDLEIRKNVSDDAVVQLLNQAKLLLYTSRLEPFGFAPLEANACGTPVVAVAEGGVRETVIDGVNGFLCDREPQALAAAMQRLLNDEALCDRMGAAGIEHVRTKWSWDASIASLEQQFEWLMEARRRRNNQAREHANCI